MEINNIDQKNKAIDGKGIDNEDVTEYLSKKIDKSDDIFNHSLFNSYLLNEIKAQDDAIRQVMSICILLISAYSAIIINIIGGRDSMNDNIWVHLANVTQSSIFNTQDNNSIIFLPLLIWILGIYISVMNLNPTSRNWPLNVLHESANQKLHEKKVIDFLIETGKRKYRTYKLSSFMMVLGLTVAFFIAILTIS